MFKDFKLAFLQSGIPMDYKNYTRLLIVFPIVVFGLCFSTTYFIVSYLQISYLLLLFPVFFTVCVVFLMMIYPYDKKRVRRNDINLNLPYALSYMASISETGVSPVAMFDSIAGFDVYGEVSTEASSIVKQTKILGKDMLTVLQAQADRTPSEDFKEVLKGLLSVLGAGGNIASYLRQKYNDIMFKKIMKEREYEKSLAVYENVFTILLVVAPLLIFIFIMLGEIISPGMVDSVFMLQLMVYILMPVGNVLFIAMLKIFKSG